MLTKLKGFLLVIDIINSIPQPQAYTVVPKVLFLNCVAFSVLGGTFLKSLPCENMLSSCLKYTVFKLIVKSV